MIETLLDVVSVILAVLLLGVIAVCIAMIVFEVYRAVRNWVMDMRAAR